MNHTVENDEIPSCLQLKHLGGGLSGHSEAG